MDRYIYCNTVYSAKHSTSKAALLVVLVITRLQDIIKMLFSLLLMLRYYWHSWSCWCSGMYWIN